MKKNFFFKFFLFTVLATLVTFTACKDYDDDIEDLQGQITTLKELSTKIEGLTADVAAAKADAAKAKADAEKAIKDANDLLGKVDAAGKAAAEAKLEAAEAKKAAAEAKEEALKALETELEKAKEELKAATDAELEKMNKLVAELTEKVEAQLGTIGVAITEVYFIENGKGPHVQFSTAIVQANEFGKGLDGAITFTKDAQVQVGGHFFVKVSPANAVVTPEMIVLQNGLGEIYEDVTVTKVEPHTNLYTRATATTGMWKVSVELNKYDEKAFAAATTTKVEGKVKNILFAVSINNTQAEFEDRQVISDYELSLGWKKYTADNKLGFTVDKKDVKDIRNRYGFTWGGLTAAKEYVWNDGAAAAVKPITSGTGINVKPGDDRSDKANYPAVQGKEIAIELTGDVKAFYVVLDSENAIESAPSEINAWESYSYTGLNTVVEGNKTTITIDSKDNAAIDDIIGFRVFAVNHDGTLQDPDGKAFYVQVGTPAGTWPVVATTAIPESTGSVSSAAVGITLPKITNTTGYTYEWTTDESEKTKSKLAFSVDFLDDSSSKILVNNASGNWNIDPSTIKKIKTTPLISDWLEYKDGKVYNGTLTIKNASQHVVATMNVSFKKELPTAAPEGFTPKDGQIINGVHTSFMVPAYSTGTTATTIDGTHGNTKALGQIFEFGTTTVKNYTFSFANSAKDEDGKLIAKGLKAPTTVSSILTVAKEFIDNSTAHEATVTYNFGKISTETKDGADYVVPVYNFNIVYSNVYKTYTWNWATKDQLELDSKTDLPYKTTVKQGETKPFTVETKHIYGVSTTDVYSTLLSKAEKLVIKSGKLISNVSKNEDYFTVGYASGVFTFTAVTADKLTVNVPSTLVISAKDYYGNDVVIEIPVTVIP